MYVRTRTNESSIRKQKKKKIERKKYWNNIFFKKELENQDYFLISHNKNTDFFYVNVSQYFLCKS